MPIIGVVTPPLLDWMYDPFGTPINLAVDSSIMLPYSAPMSFFERLDNVIKFYTINRAFAQSSEIQNDYVTKYFGNGYPNVVDVMKDVSLVLVNHDISISGVRAFAPSVVPVGGLHIVDYNESLTEVMHSYNIIIYNFQCTQYTDS